MKTKLYLSTLALLSFALLGGGSFSEEDIAIFSIMVPIILIGVGLYVAISNYVYKKNKEARLRIIKEDEEKSTDFDRSVSIGDDHCKIYFDSEQKKVLIMKVMTGGCKKEYVDGFEFPGKELTTYNRSSNSGPTFNVYDPVNRMLLSGTCKDYNIIHQVTSIAENDKNKDIAVNNTIKPRFVTLSTSKLSATGSLSTKLYNILIDECRGLIAISESGKVNKVFNYINATSLPLKRGDKSTTNTKEVGNYMFIMDDFYKVLVIIGQGTHDIINYADIIQVSYVENGTQLYTKSAGRTVGGAIVGGVLMGGAGAVVGGLSGASTQNMEIRSIEVKILLRNTNRTSCVLNFMKANRNLKTKDETDRRLYESYSKSANQAKDILSVIIDNVKQTSTAVARPVMTTTSTSVADELIKLAKLKADGVLTEEEFQAQKSKLLSS